MKNEAKTVLVTGGAGYIGSHTSLLLLERGFDVVVLDNLSNSSAESLSRVKHLAKRDLQFMRGDVRDRQLLDRLFSEQDISTVFHFAGLKAVGESVCKPLHYYENNVAGSINLCQAMTMAEVFQLVFSSSATVYGNIDTVPFREDMPTGNITNPYGRSKLMIENLLNDLALSDPRWSIASLRYFNPVGAHESGLIGEYPNEHPNNLLPYIAQVALGRLKELAVFGNDYPTKDGTGVRDYIHVMDIADGHLKALTAIVGQSGFQVWNLGTGHGYSVLEMIHAFEKASRKTIPYHIAPRRSGDIAMYFADPSKAMVELSWQTKRGLDQMMQDTWRWQSNNPQGYQS